ncbi:multiple organellar RNA editing factor 8, chloroplastic/mitochondrial [Cucurbita pepo subsp. pepo]|uniref:multiple organellar RNA editing factor 8, chloroplastic/mitochondrial n=1 Tax=Cucurbita pepo subsp. pepo TaxID=3664 RepID=UPI000C9D6D84|nr:multiple organellar RNA editing factor 8, chloroplastic/mitochondrial [Cucurbita pepo subsp. pepo]
MATRLLYRSLPKTLISASIFSRSFLTATGTALSASSHSSAFLLRRLRPLAAIVVADFRGLSPAASASAREFATSTTSSSLKDPNPNWSNRPPKETILLDGCDFEHWLIVMEKPEGDPTRDEIIDSYIKTLAMVVGSEEEARMKIYSVSTRCYYAFGCLVSEELSYKIKELPKVRWVLPDSYLDVKNKDYGGEPFINGQAVPYDPKYHEEWVRNNARANERNRRNSDGSRNFNRREHTRNREFPNASPTSGTAPSNMPPRNHDGLPQGNYSRPPPPPPNTFSRPPPPPPPPSSNFSGPPPPRPNNFSGPPPPPNNFSRPPPPPQNNFSGPPPPRPPQNNFSVPPPHNYAPPPPYNSGAPPPPYNSGAPPPPPYNSGEPQPNNHWGAPPSNYYGGASNTGGPPAQNSYREMQPNAGGWSRNVHNNQRE